MDRKDAQKMKLGLNNMKQSIMLMRKSLKKARGIGTPDASYSLGTLDMALAAIDTAINGVPKI